MRRCATLEVQRRALSRGMTLKDCSAYNIQFHQGRPIFIDTLSFEVYREGEPWIGYRQFCEHFLAPWHSKASPTIVWSSFAAPTSTASRWIWPHGSCRGGQSCGLGWVYIFIFMPGFSGPEQASQGRPKGLRPQPAGAPGPGGQPPVDRSWPAPGSRPAKAGRITTKTTHTLQKNSSARLAWSPSFSSAPSRTCVGPGCKYRLFQPGRGQDGPVDGRV